MEKYLCDSGISEDSSRCRVLLVLVATLLAMGWETAGGVMTKLIWAQHAAIPTR